MDSTDFEDFMDFFWIFSGFFDEVYGIFGVKCPSICTFITVSHLQATNVGLIFVVHSSRRSDFRFQIKIKEFNA